MDEIEINICAGFTEESAAINLSAFRTIIEASAQVIADPKPMLIAYADYFTPIIKDAIADGLMTEKEAWDTAAEALSSLFVINQRLAFMVGTELAEETGARPMPIQFMDDPIYREKDKNKMNSEEVMEELSRIMRQPGKENN